MIYVDIIEKVPRGLYGFRFHNCLVSSDGEVDAIRSIIRSSSSRPGNLRRPSEESGPVGLRVVDRFPLDRSILRCQHKKGSWQRIADFPQSNLSFLHGFKERTLNLCGSPVDLVCQDDVSKNRPQFRCKGLFVRVIDHGPDKICRKQVRGELQTSKAEIESAGEGFDRKRLGKPGHSLEEDMPVTEQAYEEPIDQLVLADKNPGYLFFTELTQALE